MELVAGGAGRVAGVRLERTALAPGAVPGGEQRALGTGEYETIPADIVLKSIGYRSVPLEGAPFDARRGVVPNVLGQVVESGDGDGGGAPVAVAGLFACGWVKRGPSGIIGTNLVDAEQVGGRASGICGEKGCAG